jgi:hypothetical protein
MGLFDVYEPEARLRCPLDGHPLTKWQGKDGPCALLVWREGCSHPVEQQVESELRLSASELDNFSLPSAFTIYSYDCPRHHPVVAVCTTRGGTWASTQLQLPRGGRSAAQGEGAAGEHARSD